MKIEDRVLFLVVTLGTAFMLAIAGTIEPWLWLGLPVCLVLAIEVIRK